MTILCFISENKKEHTEQSNKSDTSTSSGLVSHSTPSTSLTFNKVQPLQIPSKSSYNSNTRSSADNSNNQPINFIDAANENGPQPQNQNDDDLHELPSKINADVIETKIDENLQSIIKKIENIKSYNPTELDIEKLKTAR